MNEKLSVNQLGSELILIFALGNIWSTGYLVAPFLLAQGLDQNLVSSLLKVAMLLSLLGLLFNAGLMIYQQRKAFFNTAGQALLGTIACGAVYLFLPPEMASKGPYFHGLCSVLAIVFIAFKSSKLLESSGKSFD